MSFTMTLKPSWPGSANMHHNGPSPFGPQPFFTGKGVQNSKQEGVTPGTGTHLEASCAEMTGTEALPAAKTSYEDPSRDERLRSRAFLMRAYFWGNTDSHESMVIPMQPGWKDTSL